MGSTDYAIAEAASHLESTLGKGDASPVSDNVVRRNALILRSLPSSFHELHPERIGKYPLVGLTNLEWD